MPVNQKNEPQLILGDCLEKLKDIPDGSIDLTVTSPPYDNLRTYNGNIDQWNEKKWHEIIQDLFRVTKQGGVVVWVVSDATIKGSETGTSFKQALWAKECGFNLHDTMIYKKKNPIPLTHNRYEQAFEYMFVFSKGKPMVFNRIEVDKLHNVIPGNFYKKSKDQKTSKHSVENNRTLKTRNNIWTYIVGHNSVGHPAVFPEQLAHDHIISWSNEGDTVLDPMMGSGTTGVACKKLNRNFIGIELNPTYFEIDKERVIYAE